MRRSRALSNDIKTNGLREPIILFEGKILDGRNRYRACTELDIESPTRKWDGKGDPLDYVISKNLHRRHLNESQRGAVASKIATLQRRDNQHAQICASSQAEAAKKLNVSRRTIQKARVVLDKGVPELQAAVESGQVSVSAASEVAKMPASRQSEIVAGGRKSIVAAAKKNKRRRAAPGSVAAAAHYQPETEHERDLRILQSCWDASCPSARPEFLSDIADEILVLALFGTPNEICEAILSRLGVDQTKKVVRALDKRLGNIKQDCRYCEGTGFRPAQLFTPCGSPLGPERFPCDCRTGTVIGAEDWPANTSAEDRHVEHNR